MHDLDCSGHRRGVVNSQQPHLLYLVVPGVSSLERDRRQDVLAGRSPQGCLFVGSFWLLIGLMHDYVSMALRVQVRVPGRHFLGSGLRLLVLLSAR